MTVFVQLPGGRLTLVSGQSVMSSDVTSTTLWYAPHVGNSYPILDNNLVWESVDFAASPTDTIGISMSGGSKWAAGHSYDVFGTIDGTLCTSPAWTASNLASRNLIKYNGVLVNSASMTCDTSATTTVVCPQYQATYLGSITVSVTGQLTAHFSYGQNRKFEVWNAYNRIDNVLHVGYVIATTVPTNQYPAWVPFNNDPLNRANVFTGLPTLVDIEYCQNFFVNSQYGASGVMALIGWDGVNLGHNTIASSDTTSMASSIGGTARYIDSNVIGLHTATMMVAKANTTQSTAFGGVNIVPPSPYTAIEGNSVLYAKFKG